ncbi:ligase-associated DNA damage response endonuclease PdeM [Sphingobacterium yanglingense]|uniref:Putative phosphoesterase n=1 Tax=Sphingobacterium yanglingense TaxID=1437280 RepID=A0A4V3DE81_9SPHI|nr:ligase-associated DNA damage response endonuclease PdeM [Sphingobacterium yanglingense]TDQ80069.1 putative phosphoesterase [Sphingobacterium yanglingense]
MKQRIVWQGIMLDLLAQKVLYIPQYQILVISDWHLGKLGYFRQEGLFVPPMRVQDELDRLGQLLQKETVQKVIFLGDLFHSVWNREWDDFEAYLKQFPHIDFILTKGNHDLLSSVFLKQSSLQVLDYLKLDDVFILSHEPIAGLSSTILNIVGHIHPGVGVNTKGRQQFRLPCFYLNSNVLTLPAFGKWTGLYMIKKTEDNRLFPIVGNDVIELT